MNKIGDIVLKVDKIDNLWWRRIISTEKKPVCPTRNKQKIALDRTKLQNVHSLFATKQDGSERIQAGVRRHRVGSKVGLKVPRAISPASHKFCIYQLNWNQAKTKCKISRVKMRRFWEMNSKLQPDSTGNRPMMVITLVVEVLPYVIYPGIGELVCSESLLHAQEKNRLLGCQNLSEIFCLLSLDNILLDMIILTPKEQAA